MTATPLKIEMLLHFYYRGSVDERLIAKTDVALEARAWLMANQLIDDKGEITDRGAAYVKMILKTPLPVKFEGWRDHRTGEIIEDHL